MIFDLASLTESGPRPENEDSIIGVMFGEGDLIIGVADGLGGHAGGATASTIAMSLLFERLSHEPTSELSNIAMQIHTELRRLQLENNARRGMATTLSAAVLHREQMRFVHCGDTRIAVARGNGIRRLTTDHSEAQRLFDQGKISREEFTSYPRKNILDSALGINGTPRIDEGHFQLIRGDKIFITSDGLHNKILLREVFEIAQKCSSALQFTNIVGKEMEERSADDNYSLVCAFIQ